jgi:hypothetical protein
MGFRRFFHTTGHAMLRPLAFAAALLAASATAQLNGTYTINPTLPASPTNFATLTSARDALYLVAGISGPVVFEIYDDAGPYVEIMGTGYTTWQPANANLVLPHIPTASATNTVTFRAAPGEFPVFNASGLGFGVFFKGADYVTIEGIEIFGANNDGIFAWTDSNVNSTMDRNTFRGLKIHDCQASGISFYGNPNLISDCVVENCVFWNLQGTYLGAGQTPAAIRATVASPTFRNAAASAPSSATTLSGLDSGASNNTLLSAIGDNPAAAGTVSLAEVSNNIVVTGPNVNAYCMWLGGNSAVPTISEANCWWHQSPSGFTNVAAWSTFQTWQSATTRDLLSITQNPQLADPTGILARDFHLNYGSPCIDFGSGASAKDFDGLPRDLCGDIGADEYNHGSSVTYIGSGCGGLAGVPNLATFGCNPIIGNFNFGFFLSNAAANAPAIVLINAGIASIPLAGCSAEVDIASNILFLTLGTGPSGDLSLPLGLPADPLLVGISAYVTMAVADAGATNGIGFSITRTMQVTIGQ